MTAQRVTYIGGRMIEDSRGELALMTWEDYTGLKRKAKDIEDCAKYLEWARGKCSTCKIVAEGFSGNCVGCVSTGKSCWEPAF